MNEKKKEIAKTIFGFFLIFFYFWIFIQSKLFQFWYSSS